jgi:hypothetical protein
VGRMAIGCLNVVVEALAVCRCSICACGSLQGSHSSSFSLQTVQAAASTLLRVTLPDTFAVY